MTTQEMIEGLENILDYCKYHEDAPALREAIAILSQSYSTDDLISRQAAIEHYRVTDPAGIFAYCSSIIEFLESLPSIRPTCNNSEQVRYRDCREERR